MEEHNNNSIFEQIIRNIIRSQEAIIGPVAIEQAKRVPHLTLDWDNEAISIDGNEVETVNALVEVYKELFGQISVEVSKEAAASLVNRLPAGNLPNALK